MFDSYQNLNEFNNATTEAEQEERRKHESEERLELKKIQTIIRKYQLEDVTDVKKEYLRCTKGCYDEIDVNNLNQEEVQNLSYCKEGCRSTMKDLNNFFDNINFLSEEKMKNCLEKCDRNKQTNISPNLMREAFNNCSWVCFNKLDRRYLNYWREKRDKIVERHVYRVYDK